MANYPIENRVKLTYNIKVGGDLMAEFCLDCWNEMNNSNDTESNFIISDDLELCEGCGEYKRVIIREKESRFLKYLILPIDIFLLIFDFVILIATAIKHLYHKIKTRSDR